MATTTTLATTTINDLVNSLSGKTNEITGHVSNQAVTYGKDLWFSFLGINWAAPTWDLVILLFFLITILIYSFTLGRDRIVAILVSTYLSLAVATNLPYVNVLSDWIKKSGFFAFQTAAFLIIFILIFFFLSRSQVIQCSSSVGSKWWQVILFSFLQVGLLTSIVLSFLPESSMDYLSEFTKTMFLSDLGRFCWIALPILALTFLREKTSFGPRNLY